MAEGILRHYGRDRFEVFSGGIKPSVVHPIAIRVMKEIGIDISGQRSKHLNEFTGKTFDYVITVCDSAKETCPIFPAVSKMLHWNFPDPPHDEAPTEDTVNAFRKVRDLIHKKFQQVAESGF